jgi:hypothetical protein
VDEHTGKAYWLLMNCTIKVQPYLRPAADAQYPKLADNIRKAYEKMGGTGGLNGGRHRWQLILLLPWSRR